MAGASGQHAAVVYEAATLSGVTVAGFATMDNGQPSTILDCEHLGQLGNISGPAIKSGMPFVIACGSNDLRRKTTELLTTQGASFQSVVHPTAIVSPSAIIADGSVLLAGAIVGTRAVLGRCAIVNHAASVDHDCLIGDFVNISPGARLGGCVRVGTGVFIGLNASIVQGRRLGDNAIVGAGAVVTRNVEVGSTVAGVPARSIRQV